MNQIVVSGRLAREPEMKVTSGGIPYCRFTLAVVRYVSNDGVDVIDWIPVVAWRATAEACGQWLSKGQMVTVIGRLESNVVTKDDGTKQTFWQVCSSSVEFGCKAKGTADSPEPVPPPAEPEPEQPKATQTKPVARNKAAARTE